jgi:hypothetical protein
VSDRPARAPEIEINQVGDGYVVYHPAQERVHYLNHTAALVLELCTGENDASSIVGLVGAAYELPEPPAKEVEGCLDRLRTEGLVY